MAESLKTIFNLDAVRALGRALSRAEPSVRERAFVADCLKGLDELSLTERAGHIADVMRRHLPTDFEAAASALLRSLGTELTRSDESGAQPFWYMPHTIFVARYGLDHFETSMHLQLELTKRFTSEWSIRAFLVKYPRETYARLVTWARDPSVHVRRLVSEGTRPRLPWAPRLRAFQDDPSPVIALLEMLKDDPERYVQRSVANNVNDIGKDHPDIAVALCERWSVGAPAGRKWIVKHALRSLVKKGDRGALAAIGAGAAPKVKVRFVSFTPKVVKLGGLLSIAFVIESAAGAPQDLLVDYAVHFVKANGERRPKVFKLKRLTLPARGVVELSARVSFADLTTRKHYAGRHKVEALVNGEAFPLGEFDVR